MPVGVISKGACLCRPTCRRAVRFNPRPPTTVSVFSLDELPKRKLLRYPPYARLANILVWGFFLEVREVAQALAAGRRGHPRRGGPAVGKLGRRTVRHRDACAGTIAGIFLSRRLRMPISSAAITPRYSQEARAQSVNVACDVDPVNLL